MTTTRTGKDTAVQLRARDGRALLAGLAGDDLDPDGEFWQEVDPHRLAIGTGLADALHEWARVADAIGRSDQPADGAASRLIARRGEQLASRIAAVMGTPISYQDPFTGELTEVAVPAPAPRAARGGLLGWWRRQTGARPGQPEPTPWATGLTVTVVSAVLVLVIVITLSLALGAANRWLPLIANVVIALGLAPSVWLARRALVWRWVAYGVVAGIVLAWIALLFTAL